MVIKKNYASFAENDIINAIYGPLEIHKMKCVFFNSMKMKANDNEFLQQLDIITYTNMRGITN